MKHLVKKHFTVLIVLAFLASHPRVTQAQSKADYEVLKKEVQALLHKTEQLEKRLAQAEAHAAPSTVGKSVIEPPSANVQIDEKGLKIQSEDDQFTVHLGGYIQADGRFFSETSHQDQRTDTFLLRRVRPILEGTVYKDFHYFIMPDFGDGKVVLQDTYVEYTHYAEARLRVGKFREPVGLEMLQSAKDLLFVERGLPTNIVPIRDVGVMLSGEFQKGVIGYQLGIFNGVRDGSSGDIDNNDDKDVAARLWVQPFKLSNLTWLQGLGFGVAGTYGSENGALAEYKTPAQQVAFNYLSTARAEGDRYRIVPQLYYSAGSFGLLAEYALSDSEISNATNSAHVQATAWQVAASYVLTGEDASYQGVKPKRNLGDHSLGAFEMAARYGELQVGDAAFSNGFADLKQSIKGEKSLEIGLNWYLNPNVKAVLDYAHTDFDGGAIRGDRSSEDAVLTRVQLVL